VKREGGFTHHAFTFHVGCRYESLICRQNARLVRRSRLAADPVHRLAEGQAIMEAQGQPPIVPPVAGDVDALPSALRPLVE